MQEFIIREYISAIESGQYSSDGLPDFGEYRINDPNSGEEDGFSYQEAWVLEVALKDYELFERDCFELKVLGPVLVEGAEIKIGGILNSDD